MNNAELSGNIKTSDINGRLEVATKRPVITITSSNYKMILNKTALSTPEGGFTLNALSIDGTKSYVFDASLNNVSDGGFVVLFGELNDSSILVDNFGESISVEVKCSKQVIFRNLLDRNGRDGDVSVKRDAGNDDLNVFKPYIRFEFKNDKEGYVFDKFGWGLSFRFLNNKGIEFRMPTLFSYSKYMEIS